MNQKQIEIIRSVVPKLKEVLEDEQKQYKNAPGSMIAGEYYKLEKNIEKLDTIIYHLQRMTGDTKRRICTKLI